MVGDVLDLVPQHLPHRQRAIAELPIVLPVPRVHLAQKTLAMSTGLVEQSMKLESTSVSTARRALAGCRLGADFGRYVVDSVEESTVNTPCFGTPTPATLSMVLENIARVIKPQMRRGASKRGRRKKDALYHGDRARLREEQWPSRIT